MIFYVCLDKLCCLNLLNDKEGVIERSPHVYLFMACCNKVFTFFLYIDKTLCTHIQLSGCDIR